MGRAEDACFESDDEDPFVINGIRMRFVPSNQCGYVIPPHEARIMRRFNREMGYCIGPSHPIYPPPISAREKIAAFYRRAAGRSKPAVVTDVANPAAAGVTATGIKADQMTQGSLLKRPREDLGKSTGSVLVNNPNPALDSSAESTVGTKAEAKGGSFFKHPAADPSATDEVKGGSVLKRPRVDLGESNKI